MSKFIALLKYEYQNSLKVHQIHKHLFWMFLLSSICLPMAIEQTQINSIAPLFILVCLPITMLGVCGGVLEQDLQDGSLEFALITHGAFNFVMAKFLTISTCAILTSAACLPFFALFYNLSLLDSLVLLFCLMLLSIQMAAFCVFIATIQSYFQKYSGLLGSVCLPFIIPLIMLCGTLIRTLQFSLIFLMAGVFILTVSVIMLLCGYVVKQF
jgi:ABC-type transport system involved in cytochrome c biogenesis permease component